MKINPKLKVRSVAGESVVLLQVNGTADMTKVLALNSTSRLLWDELAGKEFTQEDVVKILTSNFEVDEELARKDAAAWIEQLTELGVFE